MSLPAMTTSQALSASTSGSKTFGYSSAQNSGGTSGVWRNFCLSVIFVVTAAIALPAQTYTTLHSFDGTDGANPNAALVQTNAGALFGAAALGGSQNDGTIFRITTAGVLTPGGSFAPPNGVNPDNTMIQGTDGALYGTTNFGGVNNAGTVYKIAGGHLTTLHSFDNSDGLNPLGALIQTPEGDLYGTTIFGGFGGGTAFKISTSGTFTSLHSFPANVPEGFYPYGALIRASDGNFYGTTFSGGILLEGTIYKMTPDGTVTTIHSFCLLGIPCPDGGNALRGLVQGPGGYLYGTTYRGGNAACTLADFTGCGTIFRISLSGVFTTLHQFNGSDGSGPVGELTLGTDGNLYGITTNGGVNQSCTDGCGTLFSITPSGDLTTLYNFCSQAGCADGADPISPPIQGTDGAFYGTANLGGTNNDGVVYSLSVGLGPFVKTNPTIGKVGTPVIILGTNLTGVTSVTFDGTAASFTVISSSEIKTTVPTGATSGSVQVTTSAGTLSSNLPFRVK